MIPPSPPPRSARATTRSQRASARCLRVAATGLSIAEVARSISLSDGTVRNYLSSAIQKLEARNSTEAARIAEQKGWL